jgi:hypothetical protein
MHEYEEHSWTFQRLDFGDDITSYTIHALAHSIHPLAVCLLLKGMERGSCADLLISTNTQAWAGTLRRRHARTPLSLLQHLLARSNNVSIHYRAEKTCAFLFFLRGQRTCMNEACDAPCLPYVCIGRSHSIFCTYAHRQDEWRPIFALCT